MILYPVGRFVIGISFPAEKLQEDGSFRTDAIGFFNRVGIYNTVREKHAGKIVLLIWAHYAFHVFDREGRVYVVSFEEVGAEPTAFVVKVETYSGDPHKHAFYKIGGV